MVADSGLIGWLIVADSGPIVADRWLIVAHNGFIVAHSVSKACLRSAQDLT